ncbi:16090_t:CDS:2, partial [Racocetra persica]
TPNELPFFPAASQLTFSNWDFFVLHKIEFAFLVQKWAITLIPKDVSACMPWHDIAIGFIGAPAVDVANHFIERWNYIKSRNVINYVIRYSHPILKKTEIKEFQKDIRSYNYFNETVEADTTKGTCSVQILRSVCRWSHGIEVEDSIHKPYLQAIAEAEHFIYIENQFF